MSAVSYVREDKVAIIAVNNPPVNALSQEVRIGLSDAISQFQLDEHAQISVIIGVGRLFIGGGDISEFGKPPLQPNLPEVINQIESCGKPVIAAIHGMALGGGLEVALGSHYRMGLSNTKLGLPEVKLGIIPGAGGTQRLPRLVGVDKALTMVTSGAPIDVHTAHEVGLIDHIAGGSDIRAAALDYAHTLLAQNVSARPVGDMPRPDATASISDKRQKLASASRGEVAPMIAVDAIEISTQLSLAEGLKEERKLFQKLMGTSQRAGLIHAFFAERAVSKLPEISDIRPRQVDNVGVIGGGTMGAGIATSAVLNGLAVTLVERDQDAADKARKTIIRNLDAAINRGKLDPDKREVILASKLKTVTGYGHLSDACLVIEAVFENMEVKKEVFAELDKVLKPGAILATNTSYLDVNELAESTSRPADVIGLHFFSPAHIMKLLEVVVGDKTSKDVLATAFALAKVLGKTAVRSGVCDGFIGNRILAQYRAAADHMVLDGASPYHIDKALNDFGFAMGPYQMTDLAGVDIGYATRQRKLADAHPDDRYPKFADDLYHKNWLGQKTGRGYYLYDENSRKGRPDKEVEDLIEHARSEAGITPRAFSDEEIVRRYMAAMINEAAYVIAEGIAQRPLDVDITLLYGYGFPRWHGGPMHYADQKGIDVILSDIRAFAKDDSHFWSPSPLIEKLVAEGKNFSSLNKS